jgi:hypothetical protein|tara:strand:- start:691 stop:921 length:231 start_codon:yes stop_codon:yes gene_type:complete
MRAKTIPHVEYEIFKYILDNIDIREVKNNMCPEGDTYAEDRFDKGYVSAANFINNLCERRLHRLPKDHVDYVEKET